MRKIFLFLWMLTFLHLNSQHLQLKDETLNVSSPEVANLMRFSDFPDLNYIGKVNISIPLYTINYGGMEIPLSIEYNTKGNKVSDVATVVGLGWNLSAGGSVTQRVHDTDDFIDSYNYYSDDTYEPEQAYAWHRMSKGYHTIENDQTNYSPQLGNRIWGADDINRDSSPDFYHVHAPDFNDKFYLLKTSQGSYTDLNQAAFTARFFTEVDAKLTSSQLSFTPQGYSATYSQAYSPITGGGILSSGTGTILQKINRFELVNSKGIIYDFSLVEGAKKTKLPRRVDEVFETYDDISWNLTSMYNPLTAKSIVYEYESYVNSYENLHLKTIGDMTKIIPR